MDLTESDKPLIVLLAAEETSPSVLYGLYDVLYSVGAVFPDMTMGEPGPEALDVRIAAAGADPFRCIGKVVVEPHASIEEIDRADVVIVCDMYTAIDVPPRGKYPRETAWLPPLLLRDSRPPGTARPAAVSDRFRRGRGTGGPRAGSPRRCHRCRASPSPCHPGRRRRS